MLGVTHHRPYTLHGYTDEKSACGLNVSFKVNITAQKGMVRCYIATSSISGLNSLCGFNQELVGLSVTSIPVKLHVDVSTA